MFVVVFEDIQSIPTKRPYQIQTGKQHRVLRQKQHFRKGDLDRNKVRKRLKNISKPGLETRVGKTCIRNQFSFHFGLKNHPKWSPEASKNKLRKEPKKKSKKITTLPFYGHFWGGAGGAGDTHFASIFHPSAALGTKMAPRAPPGAPRAHQGLDF